LETLRRIEQLLWRGLLLCVPVAASPLLPLGSGTLTRPLAIVPAGVLLLLAGFRIIVLRQWPRLSARGFLLLGLFFAFVTLSGLLIVYAEPPILFKGQAPLGSLLRALFTLVMGVSFYTVARLHIRTPADIRITIRYLFISMTASVAVAVFQAIALAVHGEMLRLAQALTDLFAVHYQNLKDRAQGMSYEPSWLATEILALLAPALIAASISRQSAMGQPAEPGHVWRVAGGFGVAITGLLCSGSRFGLGAMIAMLVLSSIAAARRGKFLAAGALLSVLVAGGGSLFAMGQLGTGAGSSYVLGPLRYLSSSGTVDTNDPELAANLSNTLALAGRAAAAQAAVGMWLDHPLAGVSLGNGFRHFAGYAPEWFFATGAFNTGNREGAAWLDPNSPEKGNAKNMMLRLLSETGLVGFVLFFAFFLGQIFHGPATDAYHAEFRLATALALGFGYLNTDTFADPTFWIPLALCFAMNRRPQSQGETGVHAPANRQFAMARIERTL